MEQELSQNVKNANVLAKILDASAAVDEHSNNLEKFDEEVGQLFSANSGWIDEYFEERGERTEGLIKYLTEELEVQRKAGRTDMVKTIVEKTTLVKDCQKVAEQFKELRQQVVYHGKAF